jgi:hypothetical protein
MTNLSTLLMMVNLESEIEENGSNTEEISMMEELESSMLVCAPEAAVSNILGFASSYTCVPSVLLEEIEIYKN